MLLLSKVLRNSLPLTFQYQNINSHFLSHIFLIAAVPRSCYIRWIHLERSGPWLTEHKYNKEEFISLSILKSARNRKTFPGEEIVSSIFYNLYSKRKIKRRISSWSSLCIAFLRLGCHNYKSLLGFSVFFFGLQDYQEFRSIEFSCELWIIITVVGFLCRLVAILQAIVTDGAHRIVWIPYIIRLE